MRVFPGPKRDFRALFSHRQTLEQVSDALTKAVFSYLETCNLFHQFTTQPRRLLSHRFSLSAWLTLFFLSIRQLVRGRRLVAMATLFLLPTVIAGLARHDNEHYAENVGEVEELLIFYMIPQALVPLSALFLASGMIRDEVEGQTLTYLLMRPLPRPSIYAAKLLAAWCVSAALAAVFITVAMATVHWGAEGFWGTIFPGRAARIIALSALSLMVYVALFGSLGLIVRWVLPLGVAYIVVFEGVFANVDFMVRRLTVLCDVPDEAASTAAPTGSSARS